MITELEAEEIIGTLSFARKRGPWNLLLPSPGQLGKGPSGEARQRCSQWFVAATDEDHLIAVTQTTNRRSGRLLERLGAHLEGVRTVRSTAQQRYSLTRGGKA